MRFIPFGSSVNGAALMESAEASFLARTIHSSAWWWALNNFSMLIPAK